MIEFLLKKKGIYQKNDPNAIPVESILSVNHRD
jgi:hypothetical protein